MPGPAALTVDVHIIAATNADLEHLVHEGRIREDLYYRSSGIRLPLRLLRQGRERNGASHSARASEAS